MTSNNDFNRERSFDIVESLGVITTYSTGWSKELNLVSCNGATPKYDIRDWSPDHNRMSRGITLHEKEMRLIFDLMRKKGRNSSRGGDGSQERSFEDETPEGGQEEQQAV